MIRNNTGPEPGSRRTSKIMTSRKTAAVPFELKWSLERKTRELIQRLFEPILQLRKAEMNGFNYPVDAFTKWRGHYFYLGATSRNDSADCA